MFLDANNTKEHCQEWIKAYAIVPKDSRDREAVTSPTITDETAPPTSEVIAKKLSNARQQALPRRGERERQINSIGAGHPRGRLHDGTGPLSPEGVFPSFQKFNTHTPCHLP